MSYTSPTTPTISRHVLRDYRDGTVVEHVRPGDIASGDKWRAHGTEVAGRYELETAERWKLAGLDHFVLDENQVIAVEAFHRRRARERRSGHTRHRRKLLEDVAEGSSHPWRVSEERYRDRDANHLYFIRSRKAGLNLTQRLKRANHQTRRDKQHERKRDLDDHQPVARTMALAAVTRGAAAAQEGHELRPAVLHDRDDGKENPGQERRDRCECHHGWIDRDLLEARQRLWTKPLEHTQCAERYAESKDTTHCAEQQTLVNQLTGNASPSGPEGRASRELLLPALHPYEQQVCHVRAGDQQNHADRPHQDP